MASNAGSSVPIFVVLFASKVIFSEEKEGKIEGKNDHTLRENAFALLVFVFY
tara:strand:- start:1010 stop:1165 length:156 start_codon:yes stop_codon:yes gene_type:complete